MADATLLQILQLLFETSLERDRLKARVAELEAARPPEVMQGLNGLPFKEVVNGPQ